MIKRSALVVLVGAIAMMASPAVANATESRSVGSPPVSAAAAIDGPAAASLVKNVVSARVATLVQPSAQKSVAAMAADAANQVDSAGTDTLVATEATARTAMSAERNALASQSTMFSKSTVTTTVGSLVVNGSTATAHVQITTELTFKKTAEGQPDSTGDSVDRTVTLTLTAGKWKVASISGPTGLSGWIDTIPAAAIEAQAPGAQGSDAKIAADTDTRIDGPASTARPVKLAAKPEARPLLALTQSLNTGSAVGYANAYWNTNSDLPRGLLISNPDCMNFISRALMTGGWTNNGAWWSYPVQIAVGSPFPIPAQFSHAFGVSADWRPYALSSHRGANLSSVWSLTPADVMQIDCKYDETGKRVIGPDGHLDHSVITTARDSRQMPYLTYHTTNSHNVPLNVFLAKPQAVGGAYWVTAT